MPPGDLRVDLNPPRSGTRSKFGSLDFAVPKNNVPPGRNFLGRRKSLVINFRRDPELGVGGVRWTNRCAVLSRWPKDDTPLG